MCSLRGSLPSSCTSTVHLLRSTCRSMVSTGGQSLAGNTLELGVRESRDGVLMCHLAAYFALRRRVQPLQFGLVAEDLQGRAVIAGFEGAGVERPALHEVPGEQLGLLAFENLGDLVIGDLDVAIDLPLADSPL